jgi:hypothetical protein
MVEGDSCTGLCHDQPDDRIEIAQDIAGRDPQCADTCLPQRPITRDITLGAITAAMRFAVDFNRQPSIAAKEVKYVGTQRMLTSEFQSVRPGTQDSPKQHLRQAHSAAKSSRAIYPSSLPLGHRISPSTMLRMVPLPAKSRGGF